MNILQNIQAKLLVFLFPLFFLGSIDVFGQLVADFNAFKTSGCAPLIVSFKDQSQGQGVETWKWEFGDGNTSSLKNPSNIYNTPGTYVVSLTVMKGGVYSTKKETSFITVYSRPKANFTAGPNRVGCAPLDIEFVDMSLLGATTNASLNKWLWSFGDGKTSNEKNPVHLFTNKGSHTVTLQITDTNNCSSSFFINNYIQTIKPEADFVASPLFSCKTPVSISFTNKSIGNSLSNEWDFGNGMTSVLANPTVVYNDSSDYDIRLIVKDDKGCKDTLTQFNYINISDFKASFSIDANEVCLGSSISFFNETLNASTVKWEFGDGNTSILQKPTHTYFTSGIYTVKMIATNSIGCVDTLTVKKMITIRPNPIIEFTVPRHNCRDSVEIINNTKYANSYTWVYGNSDTSFNASTIHTKKYNYLYNNITYEKPDTFLISLYASNIYGCFSPCVKDTIIIDLPHPKLTADKWGGCRPLFVQFNASNSKSYEEIIDYSWGFGNGNFANNGAVQNQLYTDLSGYDVKLTITTETGCRASIVRLVTAGDPPKAAFSYTPTINCVGALNFFTDESTGLTGDYPSWSWNIGMLGSSFQNPIIAMPDTGLFNIRLIVYNNGCSDTTIVKEAIKIKGPVAKYKYTELCPSEGNPYSVKFEDKSKMAETWRWDFGDGNNAAVRDTDYVYQNRGLYTTTLTVTNSTTGCAHSFSDTVGIRSIKASFEVDTNAACVPFSPIITGTARDAAVLKYIWNIGGVIIDSTKTPIISFDSIGVFPLELIVSDYKGCLDTLKIDSMFIGLGVMPQFVSTNNSGCTPLDVSFSDKTITDSIVVKWRWDFGNGDSSNVQNPIYEYSIPGNYSVELLMEDVNSCKNKTTINNYINATFPFPDFKVSETTVCRGSQVSFENLTIPSNGVELNYKWFFGDGAISYLKNPIHVYDSAGKYTIKLLVVDANNCDSLIIKENYIMVEDPQASFSLSDVFGICPPLNVSFYNNSTGVDSSCIYIWDFGDGNKSSIYSPFHAYSNAGVFDVKLKAITSSGCASDTILKELITVEGPKGYYTSNYNSGCNPLEVIFSVHAEDFIDFTWGFGDGNITSLSDTIVTHTYNTGGIYNPILLLHNIDCTAEANDSIGTIKVNYTPYKIETDTSILCAGEMLNVTTTTLATGANIKWSSPDTICYNCDTLNLLFVPENAKTYYLNIDNDNCSVMDSVIIKVFPLPEIESSYSDNNICSGSPVQLDVKGGISYSWIEIGQMSCLNCPNPVVFPEISTQYFVAVRDSFCAITDSIFVSVNPSAQAKFIPNPPSGIIPLTVNFENNSLYSTEYLWSFGNGRSSEVENASVVFRDTGLFLVRLISNNEFNCADTIYAEIPVGVLSNLDVPNVFTPNNDGKNDFFTVFLTSAGLEEFKGTIYNRWGETIAFWNNPNIGWNGLSSSNIPVPSGTYYYEIIALGMDNVPYRLKGSLLLIR